MKKVLLLLITVIMLTALLIGCQIQKKSYSLNEYIEYEVEGVDGEGTITAKFNYKQFIEDARIPEKYQDEIKDFKVRISQEDGLYNGDKVKLTVKYDREIEEKINAELVDKSVTITVEGLEEREYTEETKAEETAAEEQSATEGTSEEAVAEESSDIEEASQESAAEEAPEEAPAEESSAVEETPQESAAAEESSEESPAEETAEETPAQESSVAEEVAEPSPLDGYVKVSTEITEAALDLMKADAEQRIRDREAFDMDAGESLKSVYFLESVFLVSNDGTDDPKNAVYLIFRITANNTNGEFNWYDCFRYSDLTIDAEGNVAVDLETASGLWQRHIAEDNKRERYFYYTGYETMDEIREFCETELGDDYSLK
ncbi:MAG: hypothetical protein J5589_08920 [Firmicutes bacterium]|nr:hypothetical protein [Bacillota bacterium]